MTLLPAQAWAAVPGDRSGVQLPDLQQDLKVKLDQVEAAKLEGWAGAPVVPPAEYAPSNVTPPPAGSVDVPLSGDQLVQAGSLPVAIGKASPTETNPTPPAPTGTWSVAVESRTATEAAGVDGAIIKVTPPVDAATPVDVQLDYKQFEDLYGTEWASRLELKQLPECFLTTPDLPECTESKDVPTTNDPSAGTVRATVDPATSPGMGMQTMAVGGGGPMVLAASDSASGAGGTYKATSLSPSGSWTAGGSGGGFSWTYPLTVPAPPAGPAPKIAFSYSSQAVDGKTSVANGQGSWIGDGWGYEPGFVERRYRSCADDRKASPSAPNNDNATDKKKGDLCWAGDNVVMSLGGSTTELVHDATTGAWIPASDDGSRIERKTGGANGAKDGEYWVVTTRDGTRYHFGLHDVDGAGTRAVTNSVFTVPVFGNHPGEPCHQSTYAASSCTQAWRWNLDYVEDVHGNAMIVDWAQETNHYAKNEKFKEKVSYIRGGYPTQILYGLRSDNLSGAPSAKVEFSVLERCIQEGSITCSDTEFDSKNYGDKQPWWDTPSTLHCKASATDCYVSSPTFWSRKRLSSVTTYAQRTAGTTDLSAVDRWSLAQSFPKQRTDTHPPLWLESVTRTGYGVKDAQGNQPSTTLPPVSFLANVVDMPNRVATSTTDATPDFDRLRVETIRTETGGETYVDYSDPCPVGTTHPKPEENTTRCYPVHWTPDPDLQIPPIEWFNKYVVDGVIEKDRVARQSDVVTTYTYEGDAAWAKDTDEFSKPELRTYNQWRGYASVVVKKGVTANTGSANATEESQTRTRYFRGMSGDAGRATITVKDSTGAEELGQDLPPYQGMAAETIVYTKAGGSIVSRDLTWPWSQKTATRPRDGTTPLDAFRVATSRTEAIQSLSDGRTRLVRTQNTYDSTYGLLTTSEKVALSPAGPGFWTASDQQCTATTYVHNTDKHLIGLPQRVRTTAGDCGSAGTATVLSDTRTSYDALSAFGTAPVKGLPYQVDTNDAAGTGWVTTARSEYDALGRATKVTDAAGNITSTAFTPATGPAFSATVTNPLGHTVVTKADPGRGSALETTDTNNRKVTTTYDDLGRATQVWTPSQNPALNKAAYTFDYQISAHQPPVVTTSTLRDNGTYEKSLVIYDGLLRPRQSQKEALGSGRLITDTIYSAGGTVTETKNNYYADGEPEAKIFVPETVVPNSTKTAYDGLGRPTRVTTFHQGTAQHSATTRYEGEWTLTRTGMDPAGSTPLAGSRSVKTSTDVMGRTSLVQHYKTTDLTATRIAAPTAADANTTSYAYDLRGKLTKVTDASGNAWTYAYDARGRKTASTDPDMGAASFGYDNLDRQIWAKDAAGRAQYTTYDVLGRTTELREDAANGPLVAAWTFDTLIGAKGQPVASTRYYDGKAYTTEVTGYDTEYRPTGTKITIPDTPNTKGLSGTYSYSTTYTRTGKVQSTTLPATPGGLAAERLVTRYNADGAPVTLSGLTWYTADTVFSPFGEVLRTATGTAPKRVWTTNQYDPNTGRISKSTTDRETTNPNRISEVSYGYNPVGGITSITDTQPGNRVDKQCFAYDPMGQLTEAWTGNTCTGTPATDITPGPDGDGYWQTYAFDAIGNRTHLTDHDLTNEALNDEFTYAYGFKTTNNGIETTNQPHALATVDAVVKKPGSTVTSQQTYGYDSSGNTTRRTIGGDTQTLNWDRRNKLTSATSPGIGSIAIQGLAGKCMDLQYGATADGTPIQLYTCNATKAQAWRLTGDTLRFQDKCATNQGGMLRLAACDGSAAQKFTYRPADKTLHHPATDQCVDVPAGNSTDGTDLNIWTCNGAPSQQWTFSNSTSYLYDAAGNRLIEDNGTTHTLYLGETTITANAAGQVLDAFRYYSSPGAPTAVRETYGRTTGHKLTVQLADHHGTATAFVDQDNGQAVTRRKFDPYGNPRGTEPTNWMENRTYLGVGIADASTDLTHIGAREYDSTTGRFISVDPIIDITDPLQMNGYTYANANPINNSDPDGLKYYEGMYDGGFQAHPAKVAERGDHYSRTSGSRSHTHYSPEPPKKTKEKHNPKGNASAGNGNAAKTYDVSESTWFHELFYGIIKNVPDTASLFGWVAGDDDCWNGGAGSPGCDYGASYDELMLEQGVDATSDWYQVPSFLGQMFSHGRAGSGPGLLIRRGGTVSLDPCNSFLGDTEVQLADGSTKPIEDIEPGDEVLATDPDTGETSTKHVTAKIAGQGSKDLVEITIGLDSEDGTTSASVTATDGHPFWVPELREWIDATDLHPGTQLRTSSGTHVQVTAIRRWTQHAAVHNLTVAGLHTYYVLAGATPVLVHNSNCDVPSGSLQGQKLADQLRKESAGSPFTSGGFLEPEAIANSRLIMPGSDMNNKALRARFEERGGVSQWGKYSTETHQSPYGDYQVHYYMNSTSGEVMYGFDYKVVMNRR
ncbi:ricin-type beta-trefoil lectin domain protein [Streptomyces bambusae]|uniref:ricin-type beta-trefoil lectin domain protein n=1 Tax=Streptomyces bambusae TaxID=1550616 RepID=UPI0027E0547D|nr:ricin-type beta-trefoil lectin domain protein [Streptomyces bambusae]